MSFERILQEEILPRVEKPSRYLGNEVNAVHKAPGSVDIRVGLAFPDLYDLGLGNLGIHILYAAINAVGWASCERIYAPGLDMEAQLRERKLPLFTLETKSPVAELDLLGFTLQSELTYTNILNLLQLSGLSLRTSGRQPTDPLVCAGGPAVFNPEPLAPFIDFFVIGDGEDAILEIIEVLRDSRGATRSERLKRLAELEGIYVPTLYPMETLDDGRIVPALDAPPIRKRITRDLNGSTFPVDYIVPYTQQVHDRISLEVLRGCTQGCRFCQAGMTTRPVRERGLQEVDSLLQRTLDATGYEEVSLVSLSTCDYSRVRQLVENTVERARPQRVSVSLPSLRLDSFSVELADMVAETRRTGLTVAPEAASPRLRSVINKWIPDEELLQMTLAAYERGWDHVKMYFMIGLPTERDDDILAISDLAKEVVTRGRRIHRRARANLGVSTFVPKPFTPFQWAEQLSLEETERRQDLLQEALDRDPRIKFGRHDPRETFLEGLIGRADRRAADLIEAAFHQGARFDAWREHLDFGAWQRAIQQVGYDVANALRRRDRSERLPWDHIDVLIPKQWFREDWQRALKLEHALDCRHSKCHKCGVIDHERPLCASMLRRSIQGRAPESSWERSDPIAPQEPPAAQRLWLKVSRTDSARYLSHLEAVNAWLRALRRAKIPLSYSQGFHPHPKLAFSSAVPVNTQSLGEYMDITLVQRFDPQVLMSRLAEVLPQGFGVHAISEVHRSAPSLMSINTGSDYLIRLPGTDRAQLQQRVDALCALEHLEVPRRTKKRRQRRQSADRVVDLRGSIQRCELLSDEIPTLSMRLIRVDGVIAKVRELLPHLTNEPDRALVIRTETLGEINGILRPICEGWFPMPDTQGEQVPILTPVR